MTEPKPILHQADVEAVIAHVHGELAEAESPSSATAAQLADATHAINTTGKVAGKQVWDTTNNIPLFADGPLATDHWFTIAGVDTITPI
jgi:hypothetical protein